MGGKKRKLKSSQSSSTSVARNFSGSKNFSSQTQVAKDSNSKDSLMSEQLSGKGIALMDTVVRIYYEGLTDSVLNQYKKIIQSFISRNGTDHISEISLTDYYSEDGYTEVSVKTDIGNYLMTIGVSKYRLFWSKNKRLKPENETHWPKKLLYLEIRFY